MWGEGVALVPLRPAEPLWGVVGQLGLVVHIQVVTQQACHGDPQKSLLCSYNFNVPCLIF